MRIARLATSFQGRVDAEQKCAAAPGKRENRSSERRLLSAGCQRPKPGRGSVPTRGRRSVSTAVNIETAGRDVRDREVQRTARCPRTKDQAPRSRWRGAPGSERTGGLLHRYRQG